MERVLVKVYMLPQEKMEAAGMAGGMNLSLSEFCRRVITGARLESTARRRDVRDLMKLNADQARLGNLLRLALDDEGWRAPDGATDVEGLIALIRETQVVIKTRAVAL